MHLRQDSNLLASTTKIKATCVKFLFFIPKPSVNKKNARTDGSSLTKFQLCESATYSSLYPFIYDHQHPVVDALIGSFFTNRDQRSTDGIMSSKISNPPIRGRSALRDVSTS